MQHIQIDTEEGQFDGMDWQDIETLIVRLPNSTDTDFIVMSVKEGHAHHYVQTIVSLDNAINENLYTIETRIPHISNGERFNHYRLTTNDVVKVVNDFRRFYNGQDIDISSYEDVTDEF